MFKTRHIGLIIISSLFVVSACGDESTATPVPTPTVAATTTTVAPTPVPFTPTIAPTATPDLNLAASQTALNVSSLTSRAEATIKARPTSTPVPPTTTPDVAATQTARANATQTAQVKATSNAQATIAALPKPINFSGSGDKILDNIKLTTGAARLNIQHTGSGYFGVKFLDQAGDDIELAANTSGNYQGSVYIPVPKDDAYVLTVESSAGNWKIDVEDSYLVLQTTKALPAPLKGRGDTATSILLTKKGLSKFRITHNGRGYFGVMFISPRTGQMFELLVNTSGNYNGEKALQTAEGDFLLQIKADGDWTIDVV